MDTDQGIVIVSRDQDEKGLKLLFLREDIGQRIPFHVSYLRSGVLLHSYVETLQSASLDEHPPDEPQLSQRAADRQIERKELRNLD